MGTSLVAADDDANPPREEFMTMSILEQPRAGLSRAWERVTHGWNEFVARAGDALTRFRPVHGGGDVETPAERVVREGSRWGVVAAEVVLDDDIIEVAMEIPGMESDDFDIEIVDDVLVVRGEKKVERDRSRGHYHVMERAYGRFERALRLPASANDAGAKASYRRGVLHIRIPRSAPVTGARRIEVASAS